MSVTNEDRIQLLNARIQFMEDDIEVLESDIKAYREEIRKDRAEIQRLKTASTEFPPEPTKSLNPRDRMG